MALANNVLGSALKTVPPDTWALSGLTPGLRKFLEGLTKPDSDDVQFKKVLDFIEKASKFLTGNLFLKGFEWGRRGMQFGRSSFAKLTQWEQNREFGFNGIYEDLQIFMPFAQVMINLPFSQLNQDGGELFKIYADQISKSADPYKVMTELASSWLLAHIQEGVMKTTSDPAVGKNRFEQIVKKIRTKDSAEYHQFSAILRRILERFVIIFDPESTGATLPLPMHNGSNLLLARKFRNGNAKLHIPARDETLPVLEVDIFGKKIQIPPGVWQDGGLPLDVNQLRGHLGITAGGDSLLNPEKRGDYRKLFMDMLWPKLELYLDQLLKDMLVDPRTGNKQISVDMYMREIRYLLYNVVLSWVDPRGLLNMPGPVDRQQKPPMAWGPLRAIPKALEGRKIGDRFGRMIDAVEKNAYQVPGMEHLGPGQRKLVVDAYDLLSKNDLQLNEILSFMGVQEQSLGYSKKQFGDPSANITKIQSEVKAIRAQLAKFGVIPAEMEKVLAGIDEFVERVRVEYAQSYLASKLVGDLPQGANSSQKEAHKQRETAAREIVAQLFDAAEYLRMNNDTNRLKLALQQMEEKMSLAKVFEVIPMLRKMGYSLDMLEGWVCELARSQVSQIGARLFNESGSKDASQPKPEPASAQSFANQTTLVRARSRRRTVEGSTPTKTVDKGKPQQVVKPSLNQQEVEVLNLILPVLADMGPDENIKSLMVAVKELLAAYSPQAVAKAA